MRDLILLALLPYLIYASFKRPYIGLALWFWSSLVPVSVWGYGLATTVKWNFLFAIVTMCSYLISKNKPSLQRSGLVFLVIVFFLHATVSTLFNIGYEAHVWREWEYLLKSCIFFIFVVLIVREKVHVDALMWACALSISARAAMDGVKFLLSGGGHSIYSITPTFNDNNLSALATLMCLPMLFYLFTQYKQFTFFKFGLLGLIFFNVLFVLGSDSRGGFLGLIVLSGYFFLKSNKKMPIAIVTLIVVVIGLQVVDDAWFERMETIKSANEDGSFMGRVISWKLAIILAVQNPVFGGGFDAASYGPTWSSLVSNFQMVSFIPSPAPSTVHVAHSIYFQVLGDLGFVGFGYYLALLFFTFRRFDQIKTLSQAEKWRTEIGRFMMLSIVAFATAGAALSAAYNEIFIMLVGLSVVLWIPGKIKRVSSGKNTPIDTKGRAGDRQF
ncbi:putative O-glycosylation ligase, exosortase A system-associated [Alteromonas gilva]|uniref:O-glycosylation ligase, exosortase A system-associated n=1 Tax=Alteromonas gilva TaxID=2987522 RepID=A0ABT5KZZ0_9ALTE|nr:putative O-glycosylation ligase, exosortase A system-associated [Alteromonas gilva]MDC8830335.1 putative O-glycosylation ligase, exosortase A system-associated [Alteromonas gilva]